MSKKYLNTLIKIYMNGKCGSIIAEPLSIKKQVIYSYCNRLQNNMPISLIDNNITTVAI